MYRCAAVKVSCLLRDLSLAVEGMESEQYVFWTWTRQSHGSILGLRFIFVTKEYQKGGGLDLWDSLWPWALLIVAPLTPNYNIYLFFSLMPFSLASCTLESPV